MPNTLCTYEVHMYTMENRYSYLCFTKKGMLAQKVN